MEEGAVALDHLTLHAYCLYPPKNSVLYNHKVITTMTTFRLNMIVTQPLEIQKFAGIH